MILLSREILTPFDVGAPPELVHAVGRLVRCVKSTLGASFLE